MQKLTIKTNYAYYFVFGGVNLLFYNKYINEVSARTVKNKGVPRIKKERSPAARSYSIDAYWREDVGTVRTDVP
jgi:hypothetical protein